MATPRLCILIAACAITGCFFDRHGLAVARDAGIGIDAAQRDAGLRDAGPRDSGPRDSGPPDAGPPDAGPPDTGPPSCNTLYGAASGFVLCQERATECEFLTQLDHLRSCRTTCEALGGRCIDGYGDIDCTRQGGPIGCDQFHQDDICICSRGP